MINATSRLKVYVIRDDVSKQISPLFFAATQTDAERTFSQFLKSPELQNPADYSLFLVGQFDADDLCLTSETSDVTPAGYQYRVNGLTIVNQNQDKTNG